MKHKLMYLILFAVLIVSIVTGCSAQAVSENGTTESATVSEKSAAESDTVAQSAESASETTTGRTGVSASEQEKDDSQREAPVATTKSGQNQTKNTANATAGRSSTTARKQTTTKRQTTTKKQTTTQNPATSKVPTTTKKPTTTAAQGLTANDMQWIQSEAHKYMQNKGASIDSSVGSFSGRISTKDKSRSEVLAEVKEWIDFEYTECMNSGWNSVSMYCKYEKRSNGSYFIYVMYG